MARKKKKARARLVLFVPVCLLVIVAICTAVGNYWVQIAAKYQEKLDLNEKMLLLREDEAKLKAEASKLEDPDYVARYAREKYMYSKDGEIIIRLPEEIE